MNKNTGLHYEKTEKIIINNRKSKVHVLSEHLFRVESLDCIAVYNTCSALKILTFTVDLLQRPARFTIACVGLTFVFQGNIATSDLKAWNQCEYAADSLHAELLFLDQAPNVLYPLEILL